MSVAGTVVVTIDLGTLVVVDVVDGPTVELATGIVVATWTTVVDVVVFALFVTLGKVVVVVVVVVGSVVVVVVVVIGIVVVVVEVVVVAIGTAVTLNERVLAVAPAYPPPAVIDAPMVQLPASAKVTTPLEELIVQILVVELENDLVPEPTPADGVAVIVGGVSVISYGPESPARVSVREVAVTVKLLDVAVAAAYPLAAVIAEPMVHVPASTKATKPLEELTVQIPVVELENDFVPELFPTDAVADIVGGVAVIAYGPESPLKVKVRDAAVTVKLLDVAVAAAYPLAAVIEEPMVHVPASTNVTTPLEELIVQILVVELENDFVPELSAADAVADIVGGVAVNA